MALFTYKVSEVRITSGAGDYIVKYTAEVETTADPDVVQVIMVSLHPSSETIYTQDAVEAVREAAVEVLSPGGHGAVIRLHDFVIHPVDFKPHVLKKFTKQYLAEAIDRSG
jgi:hypothetical protein